MVPSQRNVKFDELKELKVENFIRFRLDILLALFCGSSETGSFPEVEFLQTGQNLGYTGGNNRGIKKALERNADYILILNNDTVLDSSAVSKLVETIKNVDGPV